MTNSELFGFLQLAAISLCLLIPILWQLCSSLRFYTKIFAAGTCIVIVSFPFALGSALRPRDPTNYKLGQWLLPKATNFLGIKWEVKGKEKLDKLTGPCVFLCNHQSFLDMIGTMQVWPERCVPMVKKELMYYGLFGLVGYLTGSIFIDRYTRSKAIEHCNKTIEYLKRKHVKLWVFPEGTRGRGDELLPFKKGAFHMALQGQFPIVPVVFSSYAPFYKADEKKFLGGGLVIMTVMDIISTKGMTVVNVEELLMTARTLMTEEYKKVSAEAAERYLANDF